MGPGFRRDDERTGRRLLRVLSNTDVAMDECQIALERGDRDGLAHPSVFDERDAIGDRQDSIHALFDQYRSHSSRPQLRNRRADSCDHRRHQAFGRLIEHNMDVVMRLAQRITVFDRGRILAEGTPPEIRENADVQRVYLGS